MKKCLALVATLTLGISMIFLPHLMAEEAKPSTAPAAEPAAEEAAQPVPAAADETEFSYGTVKSVTADQIVVSEYDYDTDKDVDVTYSVPAGTKFENVATLAEIKVGDAVDIDFLTKDGQKTAAAITVEKPTAEDENVALGADEGGEPSKTE